MIEKNTGGQAFPKQQWEYDGQNNVLTYQEDGMTLRDYFAAKAMQGFCANNSALPTEQYHFDNLADDAYRLADAMLKARET